MFLSIQKRGYAAAKTGSSPPIVSTLKQNNWNYNQKQEIAEQESSEKGSLVPEVGIEPTRGGSPAGF